MRYAHRVPEEVQNVRLEKLIPPWTVTRKVYTESLTSCHSGVSNNILLFGDIGMSHHYRVHKKGVPHVAFRKTYLSQLRAMLPLPTAQFGQRGSPETGCSAMEESPEAVGGYHRPSRRTFARRRIPRIRETPTPTRASASTSPPPERKQSFGGGGGGGLTRIDIPRVGCDPPG